MKRIFKSLGKIDIYSLALVVCGCYGIFVGQYLIGFIVITFGLLKQFVGPSFKRWIGFDKKEGEE